jgi:hypothetical protein
MNILLVLILIFIAYLFYTGTFEKFTPTETQKNHAEKIFTFLNSANRTYINYLTFLNDEHIPEPSLFNTNVYNKVNDAIKNKTLTLDNLNIIYDIFN